MFTAALDTSVMWPSAQRDFLLSLAIEHLYRPVWSSAVLEELEYHEVQKLISWDVPEQDAQARAERLISQMRGAFADAEVTDWERLDTSFGLPDPDDEHVVAAAVLGAAGVIVTSNLRDFPADALPKSLPAIGPAEFAANTVAVDPLAALRAVHAMAERSGRQGPRQSVTDILDVLRERYGMTGAVGMLQTAHQATSTGGAIVPEDAAELPPTPRNPT